MASTCFGLSKVVVETDGDVRSSSIIDDVGKSLGGYADVNSRDEA